ncbi:hypothetical protein GCM10020367_17410 [Streptomyces sannanensis]|uniref:Uncharacterized protein n=1 Tax=Streptomyces sannanensis TaxID=285536 RepID=A0ABP6S876_9ACTN
MAEYTVPDSGPLELDGGLEALRSDCARMAPHWVVPATALPAPVPPSLIHAISVPPASVQLIAGMSEYGD